MITWMQQTHEQSKSVSRTSLTFSLSSFGLGPCGANLLASTFREADRDCGRLTSDDTHYTHPTTHADIVNASSRGCGDSQKMPETDYAEGRPDF